MIRTCGQCAIFIPSQYEPTQGSGICGKLKEKLIECRNAGRIPDEKVMEDFYKSLGGTFGTAAAIFWPGSDRSKCRRFKAAA